MAGRLIIVGTPIGNLGDISQRAIDALLNCGFIAAEDTRVTAKLLNHFHIKKPMVSFHEHNRLERGDYIISRILQGETCALVSDAGMPLISDPGEELIRKCAEQNIDVSAVPGPTALITALALSGLPTGRFAFEGFLSTNKKNRLNHLQALIHEERTMIFYEAPHKLSATLKDMLKVLGDRKIAVARELTKLYEEVDRTTLSEAALKYQEVSPKGEFVLVIDGAKPEQNPPISLQEASELVQALVDSGRSVLEASKQISSEHGLKKSEVYNYFQKQSL